MDTLQTVLSVVAGTLIMPLTQWLKGKLPADFPINGIIISYLLSIAATWGLAQLFNPGMTWNEIITIAFALVGTVAQATHAITKTVNGG